MSPRQVVGLGVFFALGTVFQIGLVTFCERAEGARPPPAGPPSSAMHVVRDEHLADAAGYAPSRTAKGAKLFADSDPPECPSETVFSANVTPGRGGGIESPSGKQVMQAPQHTLAQGDAQLSPPAACAARHAIQRLIEDRSP
jgi:hypothetical protein